MFLEIYGTFEKIEKKQNEQKEIVCIEIELTEII